MAHFAEIQNNIVQRVIVVSNNDCLNAQGQESEAVGAAFCSNLLGGTWKQASYNGNIRKNYPSPGWTYDATRDAYIAPQPFPSWILDETTCRWKAPQPYPQDGHYIWDEQTTQWVNP